MSLLSFFSRRTEEGPLASAKPVMFVTLFGITPDKYSEILQVILRKFDARFRVVFCVTNDDFSTFLRHEVAFECFPSVAEQRSHADLLDWPSYLTGKWALVVGKWKPSKILSYGMNFERYFDACKDAAVPGGPS